MTPRVLYPFISALILAGVIIFCSALILPDQITPVRDVRYTKRATEFEGAGVFLEFERPDKKVSQLAISLETPKVVLTDFKTDIVWQGWSKDWNEAAIRQIRLNRNDLRLAKFHAGYKPDD